MKEIFLITLNTSGYGSPQWIYLYRAIKRKFKSSGTPIKIRAYEPKEFEKKIVPIENYERKILFTKFLWRLVPLFLCLRSWWHSDLMIITSKPSIFFSILNPKSKLIFYQLELEDFRNSSLSTTYRKVRALITRYRASFTCTTSELRAKYLAEHYDLQRVLYLKNCPPRDAVSPSKTKHLEKPRLKILYQGQISESAQARKLFKLIEKTIDIADWILVGYLERIFSKDLQRLLKKHPNIEYKGFVDAYELEKIRNHSDIGIVTWGDGPTINEKYSSPNKFYEYIAAGKVVISFFNEQMLLESRTLAGVYCSKEPDDDIQFAASAVQKLTEDNCLFISLSEQNHSDAKHIYNYEKQFEAIEFIFE